MALADENTIFSEQEIQIIRGFSAVNLTPQDPTNRYADNVAAKQLGKQVFFETRLSANGKVACSSCHGFDQALADGNKVAIGLGEGSKNTPTLINVFLNRWYFWDGRADSLWAQAFGPIESPLEMGGNWQAIYQLFQGDAPLRDGYNRVFIDAPIKQNVKPDKKTLEAFKVSIGKALAAFQMDLQQFNSPFDRYVQDLVAGRSNSNQLTWEQKQGLKIFIGKGRCNSCHFGPNFTDGEFHFIRLRSAVSHPQDTGRFGAIPPLKQSPYNTLGLHSDDRSQLKTKYLKQQQDQWAAFKTPTLRSVALTAPYMHDGSMATLRDVINHYSRFDDAAPAHHGNSQLLVPLNLTDVEAQQLEAFLHALTGSTVIPEYK